MNQITETQANILKEFSSLSSWEGRYKKIIEMGKNLPPFPEEYKTKIWLVKGCQSLVWLYASQNEKGQVVFIADSNALITKGLIALLIKYYSGLSPKEILSRPKPEFLEVLDLENHLSPTRAGGLFSLIKQIQYYAKGFYLLSQSK